LKYGLSVTGFVHPQRVLTKKGLRPGDRLILTKPLGTGIVNTAIKAGMAPAGLVEKVTALMAALNRTAAEVMATFDVHACTDVTGFGLLGHLAEMVSGSGAGARVFARSLPVIPEALEYAAMGLIPAGAYKNREFRDAMVVIEAGVDRTRQDLLFDPQTSGGLLIGVSGAQAGDLVKTLKHAGIHESAQIGEVLAGPEEKIWVV
jgi:selenide,water dikinase